MEKVAPRDGFEPPAKRLTAACSTAELPGNNGRRCIPARRGVCKPFRDTPMTAQLVIECDGGPGRNRTDVQGFAVLCITTLPPGQKGGLARTGVIAGQANCTVAPRLYGAILGGNHNAFPEARFGGHLCVRRYGVGCLRSQQAVPQKVVCKEASLHRVRKSR